MPHSEQLNCSAKIILGFASEQYSSHAFSRLPPSFYPVHCTKFLANFCLYLIKVLGFPICVKHCVWLKENSVFWLDYFLVVVFCLRQWCCWLLLLLLPLCYSLFYFGIREILWLDTYRWGVLQTNFIGVCNNWINTVSVWRNTWIFIMNLQKCRYIVNEYSLW